MKIIFLGTGTAVPSLRRNSSAYLLITDELKILIDVGPSTVKRLLETGYTVNDIDIIILTHFHVDHTADLSSFLFACNYGTIPRTKLLNILGGPGIHKFYGGLCKIYPWIFPKSYKTILKNLYQGQYCVNDLIIKAATVNHNRESIGVSFEKMKKVVFSGDTGYSKNLIKLAYKADILIVECSFPEKKVKGHMNLSILEKIVKKSQPERVILSHLYPEWDFFNGILYSPYLLAEDGMEIVL